MNEKVPYLNMLGFRESALFCGAGISKNSGLPLANELKQCIIEKLPIDKKDAEEIMASNLPFEAFLETISENTDISNILDIFKGGEPNTNHILIAKLAKNGYFKTIFTTNFDLLIERALENEGLKRGKDFEVYSDEEQFSGINFENIEGRIVKVFKIHGSIDNRDSIRTTMKAVASRTLSDKRMNVIRYLFSTGSHKKILVLGYSCSDEFDITPQIQRIEENQKEIIFVEHSKEGKEIEDVKIKERNNPFKIFPGKRIKCNTDKFIERLWSSLHGIIREEYKFIKSKAKWGKYVDDLAKGLEENKKYLKCFIAGSILYEISNFRKADEYYKKSLRNSKAVGDREGESICYIGLGNVNYGFGNFKRAIEYHKKSLQIKNKTGDRAGESKCLMKLGADHRRLGDFKRSIECHERSLEIAMAIGDKAGESNCYGNLGTVYRNLGDFKKSIKYHENSLQIQKELGDKAGESRSYAHLGNDYDGIGDFRRAIECHERSLEIAIAIGYKAGESSCYTNLGNAYCGLKKFKRAIKYHGKSLQIKNKIGDRAGESICYANLGNAYYGLKDFKKAIERYEESLQVNKETEDKAGQADCYLSLGYTYNSSGNLKNAIGSFINAEKIFKKTGQIQYLKKIYNNLSIIYEKIGDNKNAKNYKRKLKPYDKEKMEGHLQNSF